MLSNNLEKFQNKAVRFVKKLKRLGCLSDRIQGGVKLKSFK